MSKRRWMMGAAGAVAVGTAGLCTGAFSVWGAWFSPAAEENIAVVCGADVPLLPRGKRIRTLVWNVQYAGGRDRHFFYDGGDDVSVTEGEGRDTLQGIAEVIRRVDPDIILWQEIDRGSRRTGFIDQNQALLDAVAYPCHASTPYHKAPYVPHPGHEHLGKVDMHLAVWSKYKIDLATRVDLPRLDESWVRQQFNLKRALMTVRFPMADGGYFMAFNSHLSAFSNGDGTLSKQIDVLRAYMDAAESDAIPWILGADLNSLPPGDDPTRLGELGELYAEEVSPNTVLFDNHQSAVPVSEYLRDPVPWRTYLPVGSAVPDRAIDYVFYGEAVQMYSFSVLREDHGLSDHLPLRFEFEVP